MRKYLIVLFLLTFPLTGFAQDNPYEDVAPEVTITEKFYKAEIIGIVDEGQEGSGNFQQAFQTVKVRFLEGMEAGKEIEIETAAARSGQLYKTGETVIVGSVDSLGETVYYVADRYRLPSLLVIIGIFAALALLFGRLKGLTSILGLVFSIAVLVAFVVPRILAGDDPIVITLIGSFVISVVSIYLAHGVKKRVSLALAGTLITLGLATALSFAFVHFGQLFGLGSEEALFLQSGATSGLNLRGLLLGGIIIGTLGILDDVTTSQAAAVDEIRKANPKLKFNELYKRGLSVGHEHIAALINTLVLAYAGASLPLFILFTLNKSTPVWVMLNSEFIAEEIVRTLVGSSALILAVPITTFLAAYYLPRMGKGKSDGKPEFPVHSH